MLFVADSLPKFTTLLIFTVVLATILPKMPLMLEELSDMQINLPSEDSSRNLPFTAEVQSEESSDMRAILKYQ
ncbi:hypothetical protein VPJ68_05480, partial [Parabacteroides distasonis]